MREYNGYPRDIEARLAFIEKNQRKLCVLATVGFLGGLLTIGVTLFDAAEDLAVERHRREQPREWRDTPGPDRAHSPALPLPKAPP